MQNQHIEQYKGEITNKDTALVKEHFGHMKVDKECEALRAEAARAAANLQEADAAAAAATADIVQLKAAIAEAERVRTVAGGCCPACKHEGRCYNKANNSDIRDTMWLNFMG